jgi:Lon protease-like protein
MQKFIPIFPLQLVVYPTEKLNLHIFEPRYIELIQDVMQTKKRFAIPPFIKNSISEYATEVEVLSIENIDEDGKMDIKTVGVGIVRILHVIEEVAEKKYYGAIVKEIPSPIDDRQPVDEKLIELIEKMKETLQLNKPLFASYETLTAYDIAHYIGLSIEEKYRLLTIPDEKLRQNMIYYHLKSSLHQLKNNIEVMNKIKMNGHFRNEVPPKLK